jgi:hypothetical protein
MPSLDVIAEQYYRRLERMNEPESYCVWCGAGTWGNNFCSECGEKADRIVTRFFTDDIEEMQDLYTDEDGEELDEERRSFVDLVVNRYGLLIR